MLDLLRFLAAIIVVACCLVSQAYIIWFLILVDFYDMGYIEALKKPFNVVRSWRKK